MNQKSAQDLSGRAFAYRIVSITFSGKFERRYSQKWQAKPFCQEFTLRCHFFLHELDLFREQPFLFSFNFRTWPFKLFILGISNSWPCTKKFAHIQPNERFHVTLHAVSSFAVGESSEFSGRASEISLFEYSKIYLYGLFVLQLWKRSTFSLVRSWSCLVISRNCGRIFLRNFTLNTYTY